MESAGSLPGGDVWDASSTDAEILREKSLIELQGERTKVSRLEAGVERLREELTSEVQNRKLRHPIAITALAVMVLQVVVSNLIFAWYGDTNGWNISAAAISAWMGTNVVEVVAVVLVIVNYLFPHARQKDA